MGSAFELHAPYFNINKRNGIGLVLWRNPNSLLTWELKFERVTEFEEEQSHWELEIKWFDGESLKFQRL